jgi:hypothetical protein
MKTTAEILKETGFTDEQIKALDAKAIAAFDGVITSANQTLEQAELAKRAQAQQYDSEIAPALDKWANDKAAYDAKIAAYEAALKSATEGGFKIPDILTAKPAADPAAARGADGKFVPGPTGSPQYMTKEEGYKAVTTAQWVISEYMRLNNGAPPPDDLETLNSEAVSQRMGLRDYVAKKYDFAAKREAIKAAEQKKHDDAIRAEVAAAKDKEWGEKIGSNPDVRRVEVSKFSEISKAVKAGSRPDPLALSERERDAATRAAIQKEVTTQTVQ